MVLQRFLNDIGGNYALITAVLIVPLMGALALGIDYSEMTRQRQITLQALDAAGIATARRIAEGASEQAVLAYADEFFEANLGNIDRSKATLNVVLPDDSAGGGTLRMSATLRYDPYFLPAFLSGVDSSSQSSVLRFSAQTEIQLKNTLEVALVLDNSGSMDILGTGSGRKRMDLLKEAAIQLVETIATQGQQMKQIAEPVRFSVVPFAGTVNVGPQNATAAWMDTQGRSPIHHENFNWATMGNHDANRRVELDGGVYRKKGSGWGTEQNQIVTRFSLFNELERVTSQSHHWGCIRYWNSGSCREYGWITTTQTGPATAWAGCVETRPGSLAYDVTPPSSQNPASFFVPMFAPDETDRRDGWNRAAMGNWWADLTTSTNDAARQAFMPKYFVPAEQGTAYMGIYQGS
jgi:Flp pilus assembly protein TadG